MLNDSSKYEHGPVPVHPHHKQGVVELPAGKMPWSPWVALLYALAVYFLAQIGGSMLVIIYPHLRGWDKVTANHWLNTSIDAQFWFVLLTELLTFGAIWWFIRHRGASLRSLGWRRLRLKDPLYTIVGFVVYFLVYAMLLTLAIHAFPSLNVDQKQDLGFGTVAGNSGLLLTFISLVVLPPLVEETVFRGFVYTGLRNKLAPVWAGLFTSLLFASAHLEFGTGKPLLWVAAIDTFTLSLVLCYLRQKTDSLWPGIMLHALKNGVAFFSLFLITSH
jgi:membrane protease YdiL (CAAX protease family)